MSFAETLSVVTPYLVLVFACAVAAVGIFYLKKRKEEVVQQKPPLATLDTFMRKKPNNPTLSDTADTAEALPVTSETPFVASELKPPTRLEATVLRLIADKSYVVDMESTEKRKGTIAAFGTRFKVTIKPNPSKPVEKEETDSLEGDPEYD